MISEVITHLNAIISGMPYFTNVYGLTELKAKPNRQDQVICPVYFDGTKYVQIEPNHIGTTYWRELSSTSINEGESFGSCDIEFDVNHSFRLFCMTRRSEFPNDDAYSAHRLAATMIKALSLRGGSLMRSINARNLKIIPSLYSVDSRQLLSTEFSGLNLSDFKFWDIILALDFDIFIKTRQSCMTDVCDYTPSFCLQLETKIALPDA